MKRNEFPLLTEKQIDQAYKIWVSQYENENWFVDIRPKEADDMIEQLRHLHIQKRTDWLRLARITSLKTNKEVAQKLQISISSYAQLEQNEKKQKITIQKLSEAAAAMDCELIYFLRPKGKLEFNRRVFNTILPYALKHPWMKMCNQHRLHAGLAYAAKLLMSTTQVRRDQKWTLRSLPRFDPGFKKSN